MSVVSGPIISLTRTAAGTLLYSERVEMNEFHHKSRRDLGKLLFNLNLTDNNILMLEIALVI